MGPFCSASDWELRGMFNDGEFWKKAKCGDLIQNIVKENHPSAPLAPVPYCTRSQLISYHDKSGRKVAIVHQYLKPDGTIGASGKPDPKMILHNGVRYHLRAPRV